MEGRHTKDADTLWKALELGLGVHQPVLESLHEFSDAGLANVLAQPAIEHRLPITGLSASSHPAQTELRPVGSVAVEDSGDSNRELVALQALWVVRDVALQGLEGRGVDQLV